MRRTRSGPSIRQFLEHYVLVLLSEKGRTKRQLIREIMERSVGNRSYRLSGALWPAGSEMDAVLEKLAAEELVAAPKRGYRWRITKQGKKALAISEKQPEDSDGKERAAEKLVELLGPASDETSVLDVGTGQGFLALRLAQHGFRVTGIDSGSFDYSKDSLDKAREEAERQGGDVEFRQADVRRLAESDERFDYIVSSQAVHCMENQSECIQATHRLLKSGGKFLCIDYLVGLRGFLQHGFHCFLALSREEWVEMLVAQGFTDVRMYELGTYVLIECQKQ